MVTNKIKEWSSYFGTHCHLPAAAIRDLFDHIEELEIRNKRLTLQMESIAKMASDMTDPEKQRGPG